MSFNILVSGEPNSELNAIWSRCSGYWLKKIKNVQYMYIQSHQLLNLLSFALSVQFSRSVVSDSATPWIAACQASLSITNSWSLPKPMSIELLMPSNHLILCRRLLLLPSSQHQGLFQWVSSLHQVAKVLEFQLQHQSFQWTPRTDLL